MRLRNLCLTIAAGGALAACSSDLGVTNSEEPDVARALSTPDGIEAILSTGFVQMLTAVTTDASLTPAADVASFESYGSVANYNMNVRAALPRSPIDNQRGNVTKNENFRDFQELSLRARTVANALNALAALKESSGSLGSEARDLRGRAFGFFAIGLANGELALMYDSAAVIPTGIPSDSTPPLVGYAEGMELALQQLDSAIAYTNASIAAGGPDGFPLDDGWLRTTDGTTTGEEFLAIVHSTKARLRAGVARTPAERDAVDWGAVVADAAAGIEEDVTFDMDASIGWSHGWLSSMLRYGSWHNMPNWIIGMADTSSGYANWLNTPLNSRSPFLIRTPDKRFPAGEDRAQQFANSPGTGAVLPSVYFRNRSGGDTFGAPYGDSYYDHVRFRHYRLQNSTGPWVWMDETEIDMLEAEGLIRLGRASEAVPLINKTRVVNGLPPVPAGATADSRAPAQPGGGPNSCVPRTPTGPNHSLECGSLFEAMKWEKRMETTLTGYVQWFIDSRGWGDLPVGTSVMWPVPYQEMDARRKPFYNAQVQAAPSETYGFGSEG